MKTHPKFPEYVAVDHIDLPLASERQQVLGASHTGSCSECPSRECDGNADPVAGHPWSSCPITGVWMRLSSVVALRLAGHEVRFDTSEKTMSWKGD